MVEDTMFSGESKNIEYKVSLPCLLYTSDVYKRQGIRRPVLQVLFVSDDFVLVDI